MAEPTVHTMRYWCHVTPRHINLLYHWFQQHHLFPQINKTRTPLTTHLENAQIIRCQSKWKASNKRNFKANSKQLTLLGISVNIIKTENIDW